MRLLVLGINYWPEETGIGPYTTGLCEFLASRNHSVTVVTGLPYYPEWKVLRSSEHRWRTCEMRSQVRIYRSWLYVPRNATPRRRIVHEASFIVSATLKTLINASESRPDLVLVISPPLGLTLCAVMLSRLWKVPFVVQVEDLQPDAALELGMLNYGRLARILLAIEQTAYRRAALVTTLTDGMRGRILSKGVAASKVMAIPHWIEPGLSSIPLISDGSAIRRSLGLQGKFLVVHAGNMGVKQGLDVILDAAERSRCYADIVFLLVGDGAARESLQSRAARLGLNNVRFLPVQPRAVLYDLLSTIETGLITQQRTVSDILFPSKLQTLLASGRAVIGSVNRGSEVARVIRESNAGLVVAPEDPAALVEAVLKLRAEPGLRVTMGRSGRQYANKHWSQLELLNRSEVTLCEVAELPPSARRYLPVSIGEASGERLGASG